MKQNELEVAWNLLEEAMKENKPAPHQNGKQNGSSNGVTNGKRKLEEEIEEKPSNGTETSEPTNKKKKKNSEEANGVEGKDDSDTLVIDTSEKFNWTETIRNILSAKNNELKLKKLKKKIINKYQSLTGSEWSDKVENKFNKKINKIKGVVVDNEKVRLIG